jgi:hypothetical protein
MAQAGTTLHLPAGAIVSAGIEEAWSERATSEKGEAAVVEHIPVAFFAFMFGFIIAVMLEPKKLHREHTMLVALRRIVLRLRQLRVELDEAERSLSDLDSRQAHRAKVYFGDAIKSLSRALDELGELINFQGYSMEDIEQGLPK